MRDPKFVFFNRRPRLFEAFDYRTPYAFDSFAKWILNTLGPKAAGGGVAGDRRETRLKVLGVAGRGSKRRMRD
ncbi:hypothetical protein [Phenylobacterium aquaticum]|uniref:hypothetical protein n=1 Tax=Phenylobacterium aquaticum TaxID=1763816 RepID=UPI001F5D986C|nr:hypothetical protein [Phenylobacterium aquaticum]MCI3133750.1 hypothetical protein [Phenylobacterium aquaticum]